MHTLHILIITILPYSEENAALTELAPFTEEPVTPLELQTRWVIDGIVDED